MLVQWRSHFGLRLEPFGLLKVGASLAQAFRLKPFGLKMDPFYWSHFGPGLVSFWLTIEALWLKVGAMLG